MHDEREGKPSSRTLFGDASTRANFPLNIGSTTAAG
jgi:hypothetical protein